MKRWLGFSQLARTSRRSTPGAGFTITELLVVLAVSTAMLAAVILVMSGRQSEAEFTQAVRDYESKVLSVISDVRTGFYQAGFDCNTALAGPPTITDTVTTPGGNGDCTFIGKVLQPRGATDTISDIHTLIGRRTTGTASDENVENLADASAVVLGRFVPSTRETYNHVFQLQVARILRGSALVDVEAIGFLNNLGGTSVSEGGGSNILDLYGLVGSSLLESGGTLDLGSFIPLNDGAVICLVGQKNQRAKITIGANVSQTSVVTVINLTPEPPCN